MTRIEPTVALRRRTEVFTNQGSLVEQLERDREKILLASDQLFHPTLDREYLLRLGKLRVSEFLEDGREVTRAVLQAGGAVTVTNSPVHGENPATDVYNLPDLVLMALGETELWSLPPGSLKDHI